MHRVKLYPGEDGYWVAECLTFPGCISQGKTKAEAKVNIREAIDGYEAALEGIESDPKFIEMMKRSDQDIRNGRVSSQVQVELRIQKKKEGSALVINF